MGLASCSRLRRASSRCQLGSRRSTFLDVVPSGGAFPANAVLAYSSNCPPLSTCSLTPAQVSKGSSQKTQVTFTITTTAPVIAMVPSRSQTSYLCVVALLPGIDRGFQRSSRKSSKRFALFFFACSHGFRTMAGDCMQQRPPRQWHGWKWTGGNTFGKVHHDGERHCELTSATDGASAVDCELGKRLLAAWCLDPRIYICALCFFSVYLVSNVLDP